MGYCPYIEFHKNKGENSLEQSDNALKESVCSRLGSVMDKCTWLTIHQDSCVKYFFLKDDRWCDCYSRSVKI